MEKNFDNEIYNTDTEPSEYITTKNGVIVESNQDSLKVGERGPTLLEDFIFREKLMHFDHERIPERVVHARGSGAHGFFQVYEPLTKYTKAQVFQDPSIKTPVFVRFSTVLGSRGSPDNVRDVRGFATKFYTQEGNWDLVGNNIPVFFIQDAMKFPDIVHAAKPEPDSELPQASTAHDNFWDFISLTPESAHMIMWALSDRALPRSFSTMQGFGVHTFRLINEQGESTFVKFHWIPVNGVHSTTWDETVKLAGADIDFLRRDLWELIESGNYPEYELGMQFINPSMEDKFDYDLLDSTKIVPEVDVPIIRVGKLTLNRNPSNFFTETEQIAFCTQNIVPGIDFTNDPLLQGRNFSYLDTQLLRLGGPNFNQLPINRPICPVNNFFRDGYMRMTVDKGVINYEPNRFGLLKQGSGNKVNYFESFTNKMEGIKVRAKSEKFKDHFSQATMFFNSLTEYERENLISAAIVELGSVMDEDVKKRMIEMFNKINHELAVRVAEAIGISIDLDKNIKYYEKTTTEIAQIDFKPHPIKGRKVAALVDKGFDSKQLAIMKEKLGEEGCMLQTVAKTKWIKDMTESDFEVDETFKTTTPYFYDGLFIPSANVSKNGNVIQWMFEHFQHLKPIAICGEYGINLFKSSSITDIKTANTDSNEVINNYGVISSSDKQSIEDVAKEFISELKMHRHWERMKHSSYIF